MKVEIKKIQPNPCVIKLDLISFAVWQCIVRQLNNFKKQI